MTPGHSRQRSRTGSFRSQLDVDGHISTDRRPGRRDTLEVPSQHRRPTWDSDTASFTNVLHRPNSPEIVVTSGFENSNPASPSEPLAAPASPSTPGTAVFPPSP